MPNRSWVLRISVFNAVTVSGDVVISGLEQQRNGQWR
jgi:hypothetical protein